MTFGVIYAPAAARQIKKLDAGIRERVAQAIERLRVHPENGKRLKGLLTDRWSYRVGDWRIVYKIEHGRLLVLILDVAHRREVYRR